MPIKSILAALLLALVGSAACAQSGGVYNLTWNTFDGGGATFIAGGIYSIGGTIGQPDALSMSGASFVLAGGFWQSVNSVSGVGTPPPAVTPSGTPLAFRFYPPSPNPARNAVDVAFDLPEARPVRLAVYNVQGSAVRTLANSAFPAGAHRLRWAGTDQAGHRVGTGVYYLRLEAGASVAQEKVVLVQ
jgi:hypothetical protein